MTNDSQQLDPVYLAELERTFGKEFVTHGYRLRPDPLSGRRTAIGRQCAGFTARSRAQGAPVNGADFPRPVRDAVRTRRQALAKLGEHGAGLGRAGIRDVLIGQKPPPAGLEQVVADAREVLPLLDMDAIDRLRRLPHVDMPGAEAHVFLDPQQDAVYKVIHLFEDGTVDAVSPGRVTGLNDAGVAPTLAPAAPVIANETNLADYATQQLEGAMHDNIVLTELIGLTKDGRFLILKQPYVRGVAWGWSARRKSMGEQLGLKLIGANGSPTFATKLDSGEILLIVDAHERNLVYSKVEIGEKELLDEATPAFLLDATARVVDRAECDVLIPMLGKEQKLSFE